MAKRKKSRKRQVQLLYISSKGYPRFCAGPLRNKYLHIVIAEAKLGRPLRKDEQAHHYDENKLNPHPSNIYVLGEKDHGWVSSKQAWFMKNKDGKLKKEFEEFMAEKKAEQHSEIYGGGRLYMIYRKVRLADDQGSTRRRSDRKRVRLRFLSNMCARCPNKRHPDSVLCPSCILKDRERKAPHGRKGGIGRPAIKVEAVAIRPLEIKPRPIAAPSQEAQEHKG